MLSEGDRILDRYEVLSVIGRGGMGTVYRARDDESEMDVAVKVCKTDLARNARHARRLEHLFDNEADVARVLNHPNIIRVLRAEVKDGHWYFVMEFIEGGETLEHRCHPEHLLPVPRVIEILIQCAQALDHAHRQGVVHRDVKPRNILLTGDGQVKIADFGIALVIRQDHDRTQVVGNVGSLLYMAPEQIERGESTARSDIFSLGVIGYQLLTGTHPFRENSLSRSARRITREAHGDLMTARPDLPPLLGGLLDRALKKHPAGRYASALEMAADLTLILEDLGESGGRRVPLRDKLSLAQSLSFFEGFDEASMTAVLNTALWRRFDGGQRITREGGSARVFFVLANGTAGVYRGTHRLDVLGPGSSFGELGFLLPEPANTEVVALEPCTVLKMRAGALEHLAEPARLKLQTALMRSIATRLARGMDALAVQLANPRCQNSPK